MAKSDDEKERELTEIERSFAEQLQPIHDEMHALARSWTRDEADANDLFSRTHFWAWLAYPRLKEKRHFRAWFIVILKRTRFSQRRR